MMFYYYFFTLSAVLISIRISNKINDPPIDSRLALIIYFIVALLIYVIPYELLLMLNFSKLEAYAIILTTLYFLSMTRKQR